MYPISNLLTIRRKRAPTPAPPLLGGGDYSENKVAVALSRHCNLVF